MIESKSDYVAANEQLVQLNQRLKNLQTEFPGTEKGYTKAGVRKLIAKIHEDLAVYEARSEQSEAAK